MKLLRKIKSKFKWLKKVTIKKIPVYIEKEKSNILEGRCAIVTGGTGGIGNAIAEAYLQAGATVIIVGRNQNKLDDCYKKLNEKYPNIFIYKMDMTNFSNLENDFNNIKKLVNCKIDILVNCAGVVSSMNFPNITEEEFDKIMNTNLKGVVMLSQVFSKYMIENKIQGNILNIGSSSCYRPAVSAYTMSKWALRGFTLGSAKTLIKYGIVVNGIAPGPTATQMLGADDSNLNWPEIDAKRMSTVSEISSMAVRLVSNECRMIVGEMINITGGAGTLTFDDIKY